MSTQHVDTNVLGTDVSLKFDKPWAAYWMFFLRVLTGWWLMHAGLSKILENGLMMPAGSLGWFLGDTTAITYPLMDAFSGSLLPIVQFMIPVGQTLIGLGVVLGALTRLAAFNGALLMSFFYFGNHDWLHGMFSGDMMGMLLFMTIALFGAGRVWGLDAIIEKTEFVQKRPWMRYLLG
jgi:thiosulfate dehydrogenase [quinone] large subunit